MINQNLKQEVWVVFTAQSELPYLKYLKEGFRHCFVVMCDGQRWVSIDPLAHHTEIYVQDCAADFDLPAWLEAEGHVVVKTAIRQSIKPAPMMPFTCVEAVKRVLGIHKRRVLTPWQLYQYLSEEQYAEPQNEDDLKDYKYMKGVWSWVA
tara:strand:- start:952 stop:1401 length:450 start_codon:yes stop_codon:yes gene_type:complete